MREPGLDLSRLDPFGETLRADADAGVIAGAVVLVARHGTVAWHRAFGVEEGRRPMRPGSIFRIAAMTRPIVVATALSLVEAGRLALDRPVAHYLPEFAGVQVGVEEGEGAARRLVLRAPARPMTVLDLMRHTSGLTYGMFGDSLVQRLYREARVMEPSQTNAEMAARLAALPLQCDPGSTFEYGMSTDVLGRVIEVASGQALDCAVGARITQPLGLHDTGFRLPLAGSGLARPRAGPGTPAAVLFDYDTAHPPAWCSGGAGLLSTAADYARFCEMLLAGGELDGTRVLAPATVAMMLRDHLPPGIAFGASTPSLGINAPTPALGQGHGLGVGLRCRDGLSPVPGSVGDFFWGGALGTYFWADPRERIVAVLMLQENDIHVRARYRSLMRQTVYDALTGAVKQSQELT